MCLIWVNFGLYGQPRHRSAHRREADENNAEADVLAEMSVQEPSIETIAEPPYGFSVSPLDEPSTEPIIVFLVDDLLCFVVILQRHSHVQVIAHRREIIFKALASKYIIHLIVF